MAKSKTRPKKSAPKLAAKSSAANPAAKKAAAKKPAAKQPAPAAQASAPGMPQPTAEHQLLAQHAGTWKVACTFFCGPDQPPMQTVATERIEMIGPFWTVSRYETSMMGMPFVGSATLGFEPHTGQFVSTWVDSMSPAHATLRGVQKGDTIHLEGEFFSPMANCVMKHRATERHISKDERVFEMFCTPPGAPEMKMMSSHYRRA